MDAIEFFTKTISVYSLLLAIFGTIFNVISLVVCLRKKLRKTPTFIFISFIMVTDTVALYFWNIDQFLQPFYGYMIEYVSIFACRFSTFMQLSSLQASAWLLVAMSSERFLSVQLKNWRTGCFNSKKAAILSAFIIGIVCITNFHVFFTIDTTALLSLNYTGSEICIFTDGFQNWKQTHLYIYSIVPFGVLSLVNSLLIYRTIRSDKSISRTNEEKAKRKNMSISVLVMTMSFILLTLPNAIAGGYYIGLLFQSRLGFLILYICTCLLFSYHGFNFIVLMATNKKFFAEFHHIVAIIKGKKLISNGTTIASTIKKTTKIGNI